RCSCGSSRPRRTSRSCCARWPRDAHVDVNVNVNVQAHVQVHGGRRVGSEHVMKVAHVALDLLREAAWRKWFLGLFLAITFVLLLLGFTLKLDVVDGAIAGSSLFGELLFHDIRSVNAALTPLFLGTTLVAAGGGAFFLSVACADFGPSLLSPGR